jgi:choline-glycine betaine transporter
VQPEPKKKMALGLMRFVWYALCGLFALIALLGLIVELTQNAGIGSAAIAPLVFFTSFAALFFWLGRRASRKMAVKPVAAFSRGPADIKTVEAAAEKRRKEDNAKRGC